MCHHIINSSQAQVVFVKSNEQLRKFTKGIMQEAEETLPLVKMFVMWGEKIDNAVSQDCDVPVKTWKEFLNLGTIANISDDVIDTRVRGITPGHCVMMIFKSGTTGKPKAVILSHDNLTWVAAISVSNTFNLGMRID